MRQRETGSYAKDKFKSKIRSGQQKTPEALKEVRKEARQNEAMFALYEQYTKALEGSGQSSNAVQFATFRDSIVERSARVKKQSGRSTLRYKVVTRGDSVSVDIDPADK